MCVCVRGRERECVCGAAWSREIREKRCETGKIDVKGIVLVVLEVVALELDGGRDAHREVPEDGEVAVVAAVFGREAQVVGELMDRQRHHVVDAPGHKVREEQQHRAARARMHAGGGRTQRGCQHSGF